MSFPKRNLSIRAKLILIVSLGICLFGGILYAVSSQVLLESYLQIERNRVETNLERVQDALQSRLEDMNIKLRDWSQWDSSYEYVLGHMPEFEETDLGAVTLVNLEMNGLFYLDTEGKVVFGKVVDLETEEEIPMEGMMRAIANQSTIGDPDTLDIPQAVILTMPSGPLLVTSRPVVHTDGEGPVVGTMIFTKLLNGAVLVRIEQLVHLPIELYPNYDNNVPEDVVRAREMLSEKRPRVMRPLDEEIVAGYTTIYDPDKYPIFTVRITTERDIYKQAQSSFRTFIGLDVIGELLMGIFILILIEYFIMRRFARLGKEVETIGSTQDLNTRVTVDTKDEVGRLAEAINAMLTQLSEAQRKEKEAYEGQRIAAEKLIERAKEIERLNSFMLDREEKMIELKEGNMKLQQRLKEVDPETGEQK